MNICKCGCGGATGGMFQPGHDARFISQSVAAYIKAMGSAPNTEELTTRAKLEFGDDWISPALKAKFAKALDRAILTKDTPKPERKRSNPGVPKVMPDEAARRLQERMSERFWTGQTGTVQHPFQGAMVSCPARVYKYEDGRVNIKITLPDGTFTFATVAREDFAANSIFDKEGE